MQIQNFIYFYTMLGSPLFGLVLSGGQSTRMGKDKAWIEHSDGGTWVSHSFRILNPFCSALFLSCNKEQSTQEPWNQYSQIVDEEINIGPLAALLSALKFGLKLKHKPNWLLLSCDLPFLTQKSISYIVKSSFLNPCPAFCYLNPEDSKPDPMLSLWRWDSLNFLKDFYLQGNRSLRYALSLMEASTLQAPFPKELVDVDTGL